MYKYILLDIDDTLLDFSAAEEGALSKTLNHYGIEDTEHTRAVYSRVNVSYWKRFERKEITKAQLWADRFSAFGKEIGITIGCEQSVEMNTYYLNALGGFAIPLPGAEDLCRTLIQRGYRLYAVTNGNTAVQHSRLDALGYKKYFSGLFISEEVGFNKPSKEYFDVVFETIGGSRSDYLIVGDSLTSDIAGGANSGIDTCWYNPRMHENVNGPIPTYTVRNYAELSALLSESGGCHD